jgi:aryl-alcohol dehydrogenase-like predicted oxidoreductase
MSQLGLGCARLGSIAAGMGRRASIRLIHEAVDRGITWFDTADAYTAGTSEALLGAALGNRRDDVQVATKGGFVFADRGPLARHVRMLAAPLLSRRRRSTPAAPAVSPPGLGGGARYETQDFSPAHLTAALDASLRRLRTEHVDVYQLHGFGRSDAHTEPDAIAAIDDWAASAIAAGKLGRLGLAAESLEQAALAPRFGRLGAVQLPFGLLDPEAGESLIASNHGAGRHVTVRGVLGAGLLAGPPAPGEPKAARIHQVRTLAGELGVSPLQVALWFTQRPDVDVVLVGMASRRHIDDIVRWFSNPAPQLDLGAFSAPASTPRPDAR